MRMRTLARKALRTLKAIAECSRRTYAAKSYSGDLNSFLSAMGSIIPTADVANLLRILSDYYLEHRFNLLGSGWEQVRYGIQCRGIAGYRYDMGETVEPDNDGRWLAGRISAGNLREARRVWRLVEGDYQPIDWQLDFKSGYRWTEKRPSSLINLSSLPPVVGADIKVPWELARMYHMVHLAFAYGCAKRGEPGFKPPALYLQEFRNEVLDFIATNPPRFGVNWRCTMDVAIRVVNLLVAYDLFCAFGAAFDAPFMEVFKRSVYEHCWHILHHLEWSPDYRNNHYLANIAGLLFCAVYLPSSPQINAILAFAVQELISEVAFQFHEEGSNFEASTSYHRLSTEIVFYSTALLLALRPHQIEALHEYNHRIIKVGPGLAPASISFYPLEGTATSTPFPKWYIQRLHDMARFTLHLTKPSGQVVQIGDNDSGRLLKVQSAWNLMTMKQAKDRFHDSVNEDSPHDAPYLYEDSLDHSHLLAFAYGIFRDEAFKYYASRCPLEEAIARALVKNPLPVPEELPEEHIRVGSVQDWHNVIAGLNQKAKSRCIKIGGEVKGLREGLRLVAFPQFGVYIFRSAKLYLAVRCGAQRAKQRWGHAHNDQLAIEVWLNGKDVIRDPGSYLYTPLPEVRMSYRSINAHCTPAWAGVEPNSLLRGTFYPLEDCFQAECVYFGYEGLIAKHNAYGFSIYRVIIIQDDHILCSDFPDNDFNENVGNFTYATFRLPFSPGYGIRLREPAIDEATLQWLR